jgi:hypothetical protein
MAETKTIKINVTTNADQVTQDINEATTATENLGNAAEKTAGKSKMFADIKNVITGMVPGLKAAEGGVNSFSASLKALLANPVVLVITAIVGALKFIYEAFQANVKIGKEIAAVWEGISATGKQVTDAVMGMVRGIVYAGSALYKMVTGDMKGASAAMKKANDEMTTSYNQLADAATGATLAIVRGLEKQQQANNKAKKEQAVRESEINKLLVQSREILTDETASIKEKKKALEEVTKAEKASAAEKVRTAAVDLKILQDKAKALGGQAEVKMKQQIRDATIALNEAETENAMTGIKLNRQRKMLNRQEIADRKEAVAAAKEEAKEKQAAEEERLKAKTDAIDKIRKAEMEYADSLLSEQDREQAIVKRKYEELYKEAEKFGLDTTKLKEAEAGEKERIDKKYEDARLKIIADANKKANDLRIQAENEYLATIEAIQEANYQAGLTEQQREIQAVNDKYFALEEAAKENAAELAIIEEAKARELGVINDKYRKSEAEKEKQIRDGKVKLAMDALSLISNLTELFGRRSEKQAKIAFNIDKAAKIASSTIATIEGTIEAWKTAQKSPITAVMPAYPAIQAGLTAAFGAAGIAKIAAARFGGGGGSSSVTPSTGGGVGGGVMSPSFNVVGNSGMNQLAQIQQQPIQAYVVSGEVTSAQALDRNRIKNATL